MRKKKPKPEQEVEDQNFESDASSGHHGGRNGKFQHRIVDRDAPFRSSVESGPPPISHDDIPSPPSKPVIDPFARLDVLDDDDIP